MQRVINAVLKLHLYSATARAIPLARHIYVPTYDGGGVRFRQPVALTVRPRQPFVDIQIISPKLSPSSPPPPFARHTVFLYVCIGTVQYSTYMLLKLLPVTLRFLLHSLARLVAMRCSSPPRAAGNVPVQCARAVALASLSIHLNLCCFSQVTLSEHHPMDIILYTYTVYVVRLRQRNANVNYPKFPIPL